MKQTRNSGLLRGWLHHVGMWGWGSENPLPYNRGVVNI
jgi:hypothetical protein